MTSLLVTNATPVGQTQEPFETLVKCGALQWPLEVQATDLGVGVAVENTSVPRTGIIATVPTPNMP
jgi:hypothetical protein